MIVGMAGGERAVGVGHRASVCRQVVRSVQDRVEGVRVMAISFMAVGSLVQAIHSVEGSVAPAGRWPRLPGRMSDFATGQKW